MTIRSTAADILTPAIVYGLGILCPAVPSFIFTIIVKALINGDITPANLDAFLALHNLKTYPEYPQDPKPPSNFSNFEVKQPS